MLARAFAIWLIMLVVASINGAVREALLIPRYGDVGGRALSTVALSLLVALLAWLTVPWIRPASARAAWTVGIWWLGLTLAFELLAGHYLFGHPWEWLLQDYDIREGRIWPLVLLTILVAPRLAAQLRVTMPLAR